MDTRTSSTSWMIPCPKNWAQTMLARLVAKYGFSGDASHAARTSRRSLPFTSVTAPPRNFGGITRPPTGCVCSPPPALKMTTSRGSSDPFRPICRKNAANP